MSRLKKKLAALHQPRPRELPTAVPRSDAPGAARHEGPHTDSPGTELPTDGPGTELPTALPRSDARSAARHEGPSTDSPGTELPTAFPRSDARSAARHEGPHTDSPGTELPTAFPRSEARSDSRHEGPPGTAPRAPSYAPRKHVLRGSNPLRASDLAAWRADRDASKPAARPADASKPAARPADASTPNPPPPRGNAPHGTRHLSQLLDGWTWYAPPAAPLFVARRAAPPSTALGAGTLGDALATDAARIGELVELPSLRADRLLYLDLETTGLSARGGDIAFLTGLALWNADHLVVDVLTLHHPDEEAAALLAVHDWLARADAVVTYNGASFDLPFLRKRLAAHGLATDALDLPHLDLRKVVRQRMPERKGKGVNRLPRLEQDLLGLTREGDIPGSEAPARWAAYLRDEDARHIAPLVKHNLADLVSLPLLLARLASPTPAATPAQPTHHTDTLRSTATPGVSKGTTPNHHPDTLRSTATPGVSKGPDPNNHTHTLRSTATPGVSKGPHAERGDPYPMLTQARRRAESGDLPGAIALYEAAVEAGLDLKGTWRARTALGRLLERTGHHDRAIAVYEQMADSTHTDPHPHVRLEALYRARNDTANAERHATRARRLAPWK